jgi:hypothetical protein
MHRVLIQLLCVSPFRSNCPHRKTTYIYIARFMYAILGIQALEKYHFQSLSLPASSYYHAFSVLSVAGIVTVLEVQQVGVSMYCKL